MKFSHIHKHMNLLSFLMLALTFIFSCSNMESPDLPKLDGENPLGGTWFWCVNLNDNKCDAISSLADCSGDGKFVAYSCPENFYAEIPPSSSGNDNDNSSSSSNGDDDGNSSSSSNGDDNGNSSSSSNGDDNGNSSSSSNDNDNGNSSSSYNFDGTGNTFIDQRDNKVYKYEVAPNGKVWMSENLNFSKNNTIGWCFGIGTTLGNAGANLSSCNNGYGRHYTYETAMDNNLPQGICPDGWSIPSKTEWSAVNLSNMSNDFYARIRAGNYDPSTGWGNRDNYGFYWTSNLYSDFIFISYAEVEQRNNAESVEYFSVRCIMDQGSVLNCGVSTFDPVTQFCLYDEIHSRCGSSTYSITTQFCSGNNVYNKCNGEEYTPATQFCSGNTIYDKCGTAEYNPATQKCEGNIVLEKCGSDYYNSAMEFCSSNTIYDKCGTAEYNPATQFCSDNKVYSKCGTAEYNPAMEFCSSNTVYNKCGTAEYNPATQICEEGVVFAKCGNGSFNLATQFCYNNTDVYDRCGTEAYNPTTQECCGSNTYNISTQTCRDNIVLTKCGDDGYYNPETQVCHDNNATDCETIGSGGIDTDNIGNIEVNMCMRLNLNCSNPLKIFNYSNSLGYSTGTIYCTDGSIKNISCEQKDEDDYSSLCEENICAANAINGAYIIIETTTVINEYNETNKYGTLTAACW